VEFETLVDFLAWDPAASTIPVAVHADYVSLMSEALGVAIATIERRHSGEGFAIRDALEQLGDGAFTRLLLAPETNHRLFWLSREPLREVARFFSQCIDAELARQGTRIECSSARWTALGDFRVAPSGKVLRAPLISGNVFLDFDSPFAHANEGRIAQADRGRIIELVTEAHARIRDTSPLVFDFVVAFNKSLTAKRTHEPDRRFWSSSPERYIGRSVLWNADLESVDVVDVAEAIVHEATHSLLDMDERCSLYRGDEARYWVRDLALYDGGLRTQSPWTGAALPLPTFIHACFVWFGLLTFWCRAIARGTFTQRRVRERISHSLRGFLDESLLDQCTQFTTSIRPDILSSVTSMQVEVSRYVHSEGLAP
jgi:hypothetical protein